MESRKMVLMNAFAGKKNGGADSENGLVDTIGKGESKTS